MTLETKLKAWRTAGLLTDDQAAKIAAYESKQGSTPLHWLVWALGAAGALSVAAGIVSLIAANWNEIPDAVKLSTALLLLISTIIGAIRLGDRSDGWPRDLLLVLHQALVFGMIGLIAQVFHLSGHPWRAHALAFGLALPVLAVAGQALATDIALAYFTATALLLLEEYELLNNLVRINFLFGHLMVTFGLLLLALPALAPWISRASAVAFRRWSIAFIGVPVIIAAATWTFDWRSAFRHESDAPYWPLFVVIVALLLCAGAFRKRLSAANVSTAVLGLLTLAGSVYLVPIDPPTRKILGFVVFIGFSIALTFAAAKQGSKRGVNTATLLLAGRVLFLFIDLFENLTRTGFGLILTGLLLVGIAWAWWRLHGLVPVASRPNRQEGSAP